MLNAPSHIRTTALIRRWKRQTTSGSCLEQWRLRDLEVQHTCDNVEILISSDEPSSICLTPSNHRVCCKTSGTGCHKPRSSFICRSVWNGRCAIQNCTNNRLRHWCVYQYQVARRIRREGKASRDAKPKGMREQISCSALIISRKSLVPSQGDEVRKKEEKMWNGWNSSKDLKQGREVCFHRAA